MFVLLYVALWFILRGDLLYVFPCVILFMCFSVLLVLRLPRLGKRELNLMLFVRLFDLCLFGFVCFLFLLGSGKCCGPRVKLANCKSALTPPPSPPPPVVYSIDRSKAVVSVLVLPFVALWFILRGDLFYVFPCVVLFLCFLVLLMLRLPRLGRGGGGGRGLSWWFSCVCSVCACLDLSVSSSSWGLGRPAVCDCGTPRTFLLPFLCDCGTPWTFLLPFFFKKQIDS